MSAESDAPPRRDAYRFGPWLWGAKVDLAAFGGSLALALAATAFGHAVGLSGSVVPEWTYVAFILAIDVAHVYSTLYRTYFDSGELRRRPRLYAVLPLTVLGTAFALHIASPLAFWRALAYLAVFHFIRQQVGWVRIYRARAGERNGSTPRLDAWLDDATVYAAALVPVLIWHTRLPRKFAWFVQGDFAGLAFLRPFVPALEIAYAALLVAFAARETVRVVRERRVEVGRLLVVLSTVVAWWLGIVATNSDFDFTVTNVLIHGIPYLVLLWHYARARSDEAPGTVGSRITALGFGAFFGVLVALAFVEEMLWDRVAWHDRTWLFGGDGAHGPAFGPLVQSLAVAALATPQATHYALDAFLWRRRDVTPAQTRALGFRSAVAALNTRCSSDKLFQ